MRQIDEDINIYDSEFDIDLNENEEGFENLTFFGEDLRNQNRSDHENGIDFSKENESDRILAVYFNDLVDQPLLNADDEKRIAAKINFCRNRAKQFEEIIESNQIDLKKLPRVFRLRNIYQKKAENLKSTFIKSNLRLVISIAKEFTGEGLQMPDLVQEGNLGLIRAVEKFDHLRGFKFSTYAAWWIRQFISRSLMLKTRTVKIPVYILERRNMIFRAVYKLRKKMNKEPTAEQVAELSGASVFVVKKILEGTNNVYSLDRPIKTGEYKTFSALLSDKNSIAQDEFIAIRCVEKFINESLNCLDSKESNIIKMRYGLDNYERHTLDEIGKKYGVSRERIRQIEKEVFYKISHSKNGYILKSLL